MRLRNYYKHCFGNTGSVAGIVAGLPFLEIIQNKAHLLVSIQKKQKKL
jgi:hypothetical protein